MIQVTLLGRPQVLANGEPVSLPFKQAEALFYYLLVEGEVDKFSIADLIWGDKYGEEKIRSNMRNAMYVLRKAFGRDVLLEPSKNTLKLNLERDITTDMAEFCRGGKRSLELYAGDFLEGFYLKENELYNEWTENTRQRCRAIFAERLKARIGETYRAGDAGGCEALCRRLMTLDEFDETSYRYLIELLKDRKDYTGAIAIYAQLEKLLAEELFELPGQELRDIAEDVKRERNRELSRIVSEKSTISEAVQREQNLFYGRGTELETVSGLLDKFLKRAPSASVVVQGEAGIGKTGLAEHVLGPAQRRGAVVVKARCYHAEEEYILKPWQSVFEQIIDLLPRLGGGDKDQQLLGSILTFFPFLRRDGATIDLDAISTVKYTNAEKVIAGALARLARAHRFVLYFDDIQWADETSISLLRNILTSDQNGNILFVMTCREEIHDYGEAFLEDMSLAGLVKKVPLGRFDYDETVCLAGLLMPDYEFTDAVKRQLYHETEGNPFFLIEMLNNIRYNGSLVDITPNIRDVIKNRIIVLPTESRKLLELLALFFDGAPFDMLVELSGKNEYELAEMLEQLIGKRLVREEPRIDGVTFQFTHQKILEFVYAEMSLAKRTVLHNKVGTCYEKRLENKNSDVILYTKLIYHFEKSGNRKKHLRYSVKYLYSYLNTAHEYYPVLESGNIAKVFAGSFGPSATDFEGVDKRLSRIAEQIDGLVSGKPDSEEIELFSDFCHMMGRYLIRKVQYAEGMQHIFRLKELNIAGVTPTQQMYLLKANRQLICVYINRYETEKMREVIEESYRILQSGYKKEEIAIWNRLEGLYRIMTGDIAGGVARLCEAAAIFEGSREKELYLFNLAASYAWLGEAQRNSKHYVEADGYYRHAIELCERSSLIGGVCTFYTYAGLAAYDSGHLEEARRYLERAINCYDRVDLMWGRGMAHSYYALVCKRRGMYEEALDYLTRAGEYAKKLESDYEKGVLLRICAQLKREAEGNEALCRVFGPTLTDSVEWYRERAKELLKGAYSPIDEEYLAQL